MSEDFQPAAEASGDATYYEVCVELPGVPQDDIEVELLGARLTVYGIRRPPGGDAATRPFFSDRSYGAFRRSFILPDDTNLAAIEATFRDGLLTVSVPRTATAPGPRAIRIEPPRDLPWNLTEE